MIDGPKLVAEAIDAGLAGITVYAEPGAPRDLLEVATVRSVRIVEVSAGALAKVTSPVSPQTVAAVASIPTANGVAGLSGLVVVLVEINDPGNVGTLVRVAEAAGASAVVCCGDGADVWNPKVVRAAAGSSFRLPIVEGGDPIECLDQLGASGMTTLATVPSGGVSVDELDLTGDLALVLGNEAHGLDVGVLRRCDRAVSIPMAGPVESLNVAMAGTVLAFESARQRRTHGKGAASST